MDCAGLVFHCGSILRYLAAWWFLNGCPRVSLPWSLSAISDFCCDVFADLEANIRAELRLLLLASKSDAGHKGSSSLPSSPTPFPGPYLLENGHVSKPRGTSRVSILLGYADYQNQYVSSKSSKLYNPFTSGSAFTKAVAQAQAVGEMRSLDQVMRLLEERGQFARREGQEHHDSATDYTCFMRTLELGLTDLDRLVRSGGDARRTSIVWSAVLRALDRLHECQWSRGLRWSEAEGQVHPVLMGGVLSAGYSAYYAAPSLQTLKDMLRNFEGLVDSEGFRVDRNISSLVKQANQRNRAPKRSLPSSNEKTVKKKDSAS